MANERQNENRILSNREIRSRDVRLINEDGSNGGVVPFFTALNLAQNQGFDLIQINAMTNPPVCKIGDLGKYKYEAQKKQNEHKQHCKETKESKRNSKRNKRNRKRDKQQETKT